MGIDNFLVFIRWSEHAWSTISKRVKILRGQNYSGSWSLLRWAVDPPILIDEVLGPPKSMAENKWVSLGLFHPCKWGYFTGKKQKPPCRLVVSQGKQRCWSGSSQIGSGISTEVDGVFFWKLVFGRFQPVTFWWEYSKIARKMGKTMYWIWKVIGECSCNCLPQIMVSREESISGCILWTCLCVLVAVDICPFMFYCTCLYCWCSVLV